MSLYSRATCIDDFTALCLSLTFLDYVERSLLPALHSLCIALFRDLTKMEAERCRDSLEFHLGVINVHNTEHVVLLKIC